VLVERGRAGMERKLFEKEVSGKNWEKEKGRIKRMK
jgi:hypothetical protein